MRLWQERTFLEQLLILLLLCFLIIVIGLSITVGVRNRNGWGCPVLDQKEAEGSKTISNQSEDCTQSKNIQHYCTLKSCINLASELVSSLEESVDPCDDFYEYACGNWMTHTYLEEQDKVTKTSTVQDTILLRYKDLLEEGSEDEENLLAEHFVKARRYYSTCVDWGDRELDGVGSFLEDLDYIGGCPALSGDQWNGSSFNYMSSLVRLSEKGFPVNFILNVQIQSDPRNTTRLLISIDAPVFALGDPNLLDQPEATTLLLDYMDHFTGYLCRAGNGNNTNCPDPDSYADEMEQVIEVQKTLNKIFSPRPAVESREKARTNIKIGDLQSNIKEVDWLTLVQLHLNSFGNVNPEEEIMLDVSMDFLKKLSSYLKEMDSSEMGRRSLANFFAWHVMMDAAPDLTQELRLMHYDLLSNLGGRQLFPELWRRCLVDTTLRFRFSMASSYVDKYDFDFSVLAKPPIGNLVSLVRNKMKKLINETYWMDDVGKKTALRKVDKLYITIGYPEGVTSETKVNGYYRKLTIGDDHYRNSRISNIFLKSKTFGRYGKTVDRLDWEVFPTDLLGPLSSGYLFTNNSAYVSLGLAQYPFFQEENPSYVNFARLGVAVASFFAHAVDNKGSKFDESGSEKDWWSNKTRNSFNTKSQCLVKLYEDSFGSGHNISLRSRDWIASLVAEDTALRQAYKAYVQEMNTFLPLRLPGLNLNPKQLFWTSYASAMCEKFSPTLAGDEFEQEIPASYRVNVPLSINRDFAKDFDCPAGSKMRNEAQQGCRIWGA